tara:strand:- start:27 stop:134 length:108 start_codon:yes stop_codon:yes gene_type:complete
MSKGELFLVFAALAIFVAIVAWLFLLTINGGRTDG